jgi:CSLREA domain-containing protein
MVSSPLALLALVLLVSPRTEAAVETETVVDTLEDELNTDGDCSLREAIEAANTNAGVDACPAGDGVLTDTISFNVAGTISLLARAPVSSSRRTRAFAHRLSFAYSAARRSRVGCKANEAPVPCS